MNTTTGQLHDLGQRIWLDNVTRELLKSGTLERYIGELMARIRQKSLTALPARATAA